MTQTLGNPEEAASVAALFSLVCPMLQLGPLPHCQGTARGLPPPQISTGLQQPQNIPRQNGSAAPAMPD